LIIRLPSFELDVIYEATGIVELSADVSERPMISSFLMLVVTLALFAVWFRYTCVLILKSKPAKDYSLEVASANELNFVRVQRSLPGVREGAISTRC
jgi:hypothetical protein